MVDVLGSFDIEHMRKILPARCPAGKFLEHIRTNLRIPDTDTILHIGITEATEERYGLYVITIKPVVDYLAPVTHFRSNDKLVKSAWTFNDILIEASLIDFRQMTMRMSSHGLTPPDVVFGKPLYSINPSWQESYIAVAYNNGLASMVAYECKNRGMKLEWMPGRVPDDKEFISRSQCGPSVNKRRAACERRGKTIVDKLPLTDAFMETMEWFHGDQLRSK